MRSVCWTGCLALSALAIQGCGGAGKPPEPKLDLVPVTGVVTLDGKPLADATVSFLFDGKPPEGFDASGCKTDSFGKFIVMTGSKPGTVPGRYKIVVSRLVSPDGSPVKSDPSTGFDMQMRKMGGELKELVPERYSNLEKTELSAVVAAGEKTEVELKLSGS
jgi:hypothetical protein